MIIYDSTVITDSYVMLDVDIMGGEAPYVGVVIVVTTPNYTPTGTDVEAGDIVVLRGDDLGVVDMSGLDETESNSITVKLSGSIDQFIPKAGVTVLTGAGGCSSILSFDGLLC